MRIVLILLVTLANSAFAQEDVLTADDIKNAMNNVSSEYATCAAYFAHVAFAAQNSDSQEVFDAYSSLYDEVMVLAVMTAGHERSDEMALKVTKARIDMFMEEMRVEIENDYSNLKKQILRAFVFRFLRD